MIKGAIFDMDGVLVDNARFHIRAWQQLGGEFGKDLSDGEIRRIFGQRNREMLTTLIGRSFSDEEVERTTGHKEEIYRTIIAAEIVPMPGLIELLAELRKIGIGTAVATSGPKENVAFVMEKLGLGPYFDTVATGIEVAHAKPAPDIFLLAAQRLNQPPSQCVVFEDSTAGIEAAHRAGIPCIALATTHTSAELARTSAMRIIQDFRELHTSDLQEISNPKAQSKENKPQRPQRHQSL